MSRLQTTERPRRRSTPQTTRPADFHPEIQGLRAVAVMIVVLFHLWPNRLSGGFVGVDVFFVISGYLITSHIHREVAATGSLSLRRFWARRIRRLLPASFLVLAVSAVALLVFLPATLWADSARQIGASALYIQNWALVADSVDYLSQDNAPTLVQHYWSLSVEEQFYVLWPLLVMAVILLARRSKRVSTDGHRGLLFAALAAVATISFVYSVFATASDQGVAYFATTTRVWEFAAGALLALAGCRLRLTRTASFALGWAGLAAIMIAAVLYDGASLFPGWIAALPVLGAVAVIAAGSSTSAASASCWLSTRPATFLGDISYSIYLWHWPLIVVVPFITEVDLRTTDKLLILLVTIGLSWVSKVVVEDPMRTTRLLTKAPWRSFVFAAAGMALIVGAGVATSAEVDQRAAEAKTQTEKVLSGGLVTGCVGPAALNPANDCESIVGTGDLLPPPEAVIKSNRTPLFATCQANLGARKLAPCTIGSTSKDPERTIALVGDSHAGQWFSTFDTMGKTRNWAVKTFAKASCPVTAADRVLPSEQNDDERDNCRAWSDDVRKAIADDDSISQVYTTAFSSAYDWDSADGEPLDEPSTDGFLEVWKEWIADDKDVFVIKDVPRTKGDVVPTCLAGNLDNRKSCGMSREEGLPDDAIADAARVDGSDVGLLDLTKQFCDDASCYAVVGDLIVYRDRSHLTNEYARALAPYLEDQIDKAER